jgi:hypothetical protein
MSGTVGKKLTPGSMGIDMMHKNQLLGSLSPANQFRISIFLLLFFAVILLFSREAAREHRTQESQCLATVWAAVYYADPVSQTCGMRKGRRDQLSGSACATILEQPVFAHVRHCWPSLNTK